MDFKEMSKRGGKYFLYFLVFAIIGGIFIGAGRAVMGEAAVEATLEAAMEAATTGTIPEAVNIGAGFTWGLVLTIIGQLVMVVGGFAVLFKMIVEGVWRAEEGE